MILPSNVQFARPRLLYVYTKLSARVKTQEITLHHLQTPPSYVLLQPFHPVPTYQYSLWVHRCVWGSPIRVACCSFCRACRYGCAKIKRTLMTPTIVTPPPKNEIVCENRKMLSLLAETRRKNDTGIPSQATNTHKYIPDFQVQRRIRSAPLLVWWRASTRSSNKISSNIEALP